MYVSKNRRHGRMCFYKYMSAETAMKILTTKTLRFSSPLIFNDPFDATRILRMPFNEYGFTAKFVTEFANMIRRNESPDSIMSEDVQAILRYTYNLTSDQREQLAAAIENELYENMNIEGKLISDLQGEWNRMLPKSRILSLTEENNNPVMWSSYSNNYTGVVLELACLDVLDTPLLLAEPVTYSDDLALLGSYDYWIDLLLGKIKFDYTKTFRKLELTKKSKWAYEKEWRILSFENNSDQLFDDYMISPLVFSKVYFGKDVYDKNKRELISIAKNELKHIQFFDMYLNYNNHEIQFRILT